MTIKNNVLLACLMASGFPVFVQAAQPSMFGQWLAQAAGTSPAGSTAAAPSIPAGDDNAEPTVIIKRFEIEGPELVPRADLQRVLSGYLNVPLTFGDLRKATSAAENVHTKAGYEVVRVILPEQELDESGVLRLQVVDARLDMVSVTGNKFFSADNIQSSLPVLEKGTLINTAQMDQNLRLANDNLSKQVQIGLSPSDKSGLVDANVRVLDESPHKTFLTLDNTGTRATGRFRLGAVYQNTNMFDKDHQLSLQALTSPDNHASDVKVAGIAYKIPFYNLGGALEANFNYSSVNAGVLSTGAGPLGISGKGKIGALRWNHVLPRLAGWDQRLAASAEYKLFESSVLLNGTGQSIIPDLETRPVGLNYTALLRSGAEDAFVSAGVFRNISTGGKNSTSSYQQAGGRANATADFTILKLLGTWSHRFTNNWTLRAESNAQYTEDALIPGEQFGAGGAYSVRGFNERELSQDKGIRESLELTTPDLPYVGESGRYLRAAVFADAAQLRRNKALSSETSHQSVSSVGAGLRYSFMPGQNLRLDVARVVRGAGVQPNGDVMIHFSFAMSL